MSIDRPGGLAPGEAVMSRPGTRPLPIVQLKLRVFYLVTGIPRHVAAHNDVTGNDIGTAHGILYMI
jgi:hypothetical protein